MWMVNPIILCTENHHLQGEHGEIHKFRHNFVKGHSIKGRVSPIVQIEPMSMKIRHDQLAAELIRRGGTHKSPYDLPDLSYLPDEHRLVVVDVEKSLSDLISRCSFCANRYNKLVKNGPFLV